MVEFERWQLFQGLNFLLQQRNPFFVRLLHVVVLFFEIVGKLQQIVFVLHFMYIRDLFNYIVNMYAFEVCCIYARAMKLLVHVRNNASKGIPATSFGTVAAAASKRSAASATVAASASVQATEYAQQDACGAGDAANDVGWRHVGTILE